MNILFDLSKENIFLAKAEVEALLKKKGKLNNNLLLIDSTKANAEILAQRLALTHRIYQVLFEVDVKNLDELKNFKNLADKIKKFNWQKIYSKNFAVALQGKTAVRPKELADLIWVKLKNPKCDLKNPNTSINFLFEKNRVYVTLLLHEIKKDFLERLPHKKPELHPTSLNPKIARAMINLTGIKRGKLYDPFCGSCGILVEASFLGLIPVGYDISDFMLSKAKINFEFYKIKNYKISLADATTIKHKMDYIASDLPYGRNSQKTDSLQKLYFDFLKNAQFKVAVLGFPDFVDYKKIIKQTNRKIESEFTIYLHKTLSKKIVVIR